MKSYDIKGCWHHHNYLRLFEQDDVMHLSTIQLSN